MFRRLYLLLFVSAIAICAHSQSQLIFVTDTISFSSVSIDSNTQVLTVTDTFRNAGGGSFAGTVYLNGRLNGGAAFPIDSIYFNNLDTVPGHNDSLIRFNIPVGQTSGPAHFVGGPNTLVIWPIYSQQPFTDSLYINIYVTRITLGIEEPKLVNMYLVQSGGMLNVQFAQAQDIVKQVSIYDLGGRQLYTGTEDQSHHIPVAGWTAGIYLCEVQTYQGERRTIKFVLQ